MRGHCSEEPVHPGVSIWRGCHLWEAEGEGRGRGREKKGERRGGGEERRVPPHPGPRLLRRTLAELALLRPRSQPQDSSFPVLGMLTGPWVREDTLLPPPPPHLGSSTHMWCCQLGESLCLSPVAAAQMTDWGPQQRGPPSHSGGQNSTLGALRGPQPPGGAGEDPSYHLRPSAAPCSWVCGCTPPPAASTATWSVSVWLYPAMHLHARTPVVLDSGTTLTQHGTVLTLFQLQRLHFHQSHTLTFPGTLFGCPVASKLGVCWTDILHRSQGGAPASSHAASYGPGTPEARGHHGKDMAPWAHESHCGAGKPSQAMGLGRVRRASLQAGPRGEPRGQ